MKNAYIKALCLALALIAFTSALPGCKGGADVPDTTQDESTGNGESYMPHPSDPNDPTSPNYYDGAEFVIACQAGNEQSDVFFDERLTYELDRQIKARNEAVEKKLGVKIIESSKQNLAEYINELTLSEQAPDLIYASGNGGMSELMLYGSLASLSDYRGNNTTAAGISVSVVQQLSVYGELYMLTGAPIRSSLDSATVVAYNTKALSALGYEQGYLCQSVLDGDWTLDKMTVIAKQAAALNSEDASYRAVSGNMNSLYSLWKGLGARTVEKANGDVPTIAIHTPKNVYLFEAVNGFSDEVGGIPDGSESLFYIGKISDARSAFKEDFGVLPMPAYNEGGEYTCLLDFDSTYFTAMPKTAENREMTLDFLREFYSESVDTVYPQIIGDECFKNTEVLDIILKSRYFDFLDMYGIGHIVSTAFYSQTDKENFDSLLLLRDTFARDALEIALGKSVGEG